jgi:hypothetical protein
MEAAEKWLRQEAPKKGLTVWRGRFKGFTLPYDVTLDCIVMGYKESNEEKPQQTLSALAISCGSMAMIKSDNFSSMVPFGGGWEPFEEMKKTAKEVFERL